MIVLTVFQSLSPRLGRNRVKYYRVMVLGSAHKRFSAY